MASDFSVSYSCFSTIKSVFFKGTSQKKLVLKNYFEKGTSNRLKQFKKNSKYWVAYYGYCIHLTDVFQNTALIVYTTYNSVQPK